MPAPTNGRCPICGDKRENPNAAVCYGCYLDALVPRWYPAAEEYAYDPIWQHQNATAKPRTGIDLLDGTPTRISELPHGPNVRPR